MHEEAPSSQHNIPRKPVPSDCAVTVQHVSTHDYQHLSDTEPVEPFDPDETSDSRPRQTSSQLQRLSRTTLPWLSDLTWALTAILLLVALVALLHTTDGRPLPEWPLGLTVNSVVALLATACRACFFVPVMEGLSQLKWNWFAGGKARPLNDVQVLGEASRGAWGSLRMVALGKGWILGFMATVVLVTGMATSTLTQSAVAFQTRMVPDPRLSATAYSCPLFAQYWQAWEAKKSRDEILRAAFAGVFHPPGEDLVPIDSSCPSGNCRWPPFDSLAVCVTAKNITEHLKIRSETTDEAGGNTTLWIADLPKVGLTMNATFRGHTDGEAIMFSPDYEGEDEEVIHFKPPQTSIAFGNDTDLQKTTFSQFYILYDNKVHMPLQMSFRAVELAYHFCVKTYNVSVEEGKTRTDVLESSYRIGEEPAGGEYFNITKLDGSGGLAVQYSEVYDRLGGAFAREFGGEVRGGGTSFRGLQQELGRKLFARATIRTLKFSDRMWGPGQAERVTARDIDLRLWDNMMQMTGNIAMSMTNFMRQNEPNVTSLGADLPSRTQVGDALVPVTFVEVRWEWLAFLAVQIAIALAFLGGVVFHTARLGVDVVKSSDVAGMFAVARPDYAPMIQKTGSVDITAQVASGLRQSVDKGLVGKLKRGPEGWVLEVRSEDTRCKPIEEKKKGFRLW